MMANTGSDSALGLTDYDNNRLLKKKRMLPHLWQLSLIITFEYK